jgi:hypothetical protein
MELELTPDGNPFALDCTLAKGRYRFFILARDLAGNSQAKVASNTLCVR